MEQKLMAAHRGVLREENLALRQILGYTRESIDAAATLQVPQIGRFIPNTSIKDILIVAIDIDHILMQLPIQDQSHHIGVSLLDTRCLASPVDDMREAITSYQFITKDSPSCRNAEKRFLFGETEMISLSGLATRVAELVHGRDYVLVGHGTVEDVKVLNRIDPDIVGRAGYIFDTVKTAQFPLQLYYRYNLETLLDELGIKHANLHAAGNDAHFALKALLMLAVRDGRLGQHPENSGEEDLFSTLDTIAHAPVNLSVLISKSPPKPFAPKKEKLGIYAKRRLRAEMKAKRKILEATPPAQTAVESLEEGN
ncbi:hypothetical protein PWT90_00401 [Aphanocladium album]|nr:hypothetical protein PWT90_00401 [Aphanocladium album]